MRQRVPRHGAIALLRLFCGLLLSGSFAHAQAGSSWIFDVRSGVFFDSNVSRSDRSADEEADFASRTTIAAGQGFQLTDDLRLSIFGKVEAQFWTTYDGLSNVRPGIDSNLRYRFGLGRNAPWIRATAHCSYADFSENDRSGWFLRPGLSGGFSVSERLRFDGGYEYERFDAREAVWAREGHHVFAHATFDLTASTQLVLGYTFRRGDVTSAAIPPRPDIVAIADVRELINTFDKPYMAYRFPAATHSVSVGVSQALSTFAAVQATYEFQRTSHDPLHYVNHIAEVAIAFSF